MVGDSGVGKSCILEKLLDSASTNTFISTIGVDVKNHTLKDNGRSVKLQASCFEDLQKIYLHNLECRYFSKFAEEHLALEQFLAILDPLSQEFFFKHGLTLYVEAKVLNV